VFFYFICAAGLNAEWEIAAASRFKSQDCQCVPIMLEFEKTADEKQFAAFFPGFSCGVLL
jgi:hypothetical protein